MNSAPKAHLSSLQIFRSRANNGSMKTDTIDLLTRLTSRELRERLCQLAAQEKSVRVLLRAALARERTEQQSAETERKGAVGER